MEIRNQTMYLLQKEIELLEIVQLVGPDALPESEKLILEVTRMIREDFLQQSAYSDVDSYCPLDKQYWMLRIIHTFHHEASVKMVQGATLKQVMGIPERNEISRMKEASGAARLQELNGAIAERMKSLEVES